MSVRERERTKGENRERETGTEEERQGERERDRERGRETGREGERQGERERDRERGRETCEYHRVIRKGCCGGELRTHNFSRVRSIVIVQSIFCSKLVFENFYKNSQKIRGGMAGDV